MSDLSITTIDAAPIGRDIIDDRSELREEVLCVHVPRVVSIPQPLCT